MEVRCNRCDSFLFEYEVAEDFPEFLQGKLKIRVKCKCKLFTCISRFEKEPKVEPKLEANK